MPAGKRRALLALSILCLIWGYNWVMMKEALRFAAPFDFVALRALASALLLFLAMAVRRTPLVPQAPLAYLFLGLTQTTGFLGLSTWALVEGGAGKTAVLVFTMPFWTLLLAWPALGERMHGRQWAAVLLALLGLVLVLEPWNLSTPLKSKLLAVGAGISWAVSNVFAKWLRQRRSLDLLPLTAWQMLFGSLVLIAVAAVVPGRAMIWTPYFGWIMAYTALLGTVAGWLLWLYVLNHLTAGTASLSLLAVPVIGLVSSHLQLGEVPGSSELAGALLIGAAILMLAGIAAQQGTAADSDRPLIPRPGRTPPAA